MNEQLSTCINIKNTVAAIIFFAIVFSCACLFCMAVYIKHNLTHIFHLFLSVLLYNLNVTVRQQRKVQSETLPPWEITDATVDKMLFNNITKFQYFTAYCMAKIQWVLNTGSSNILSFYWVHGCMFPITEHIISIIKRSYF